MPFGYIKYLEFGVVCDGCVSDAGTDILASEYILELNLVPIFDIYSLHSLLPSIILSSFHLNISL